MIFYSPQPNTMERSESESSGGAAGFLEFLSDSEPPPNVESVKKHGSINFSSTDKQKPEQLKSIENVLNDEVERVAYMLFLKNERSSENLAFWIDCEALSQCNESEMDEKVKLIYQKYLKPGARQHVNIPESMSNEMEKLVKAGGPFTPDIFLKPQKAVKILMQSNSFPRFVASRMSTRISVETIGNPQLTSFDGLLREAYNWNGWKPVKQASNVVITKKLFGADELYRMELSIRAPPIFVSEIFADPTKRKDWESSFHKFEEVQRVKEKDFVIHEFYKFGYTKRDAAVFQQQQTSSSGAVMLLRSGCLHSKIPETKYIFDHTGVVFKPEGSSNTDVVWIVQLASNGIWLSNFDKNGIVKKLFQMGNSFRDYSHKVLKSKS